MTSKIHDVQCAVALKRTTTKDRKEEKGEHFKAYYQPPINAAT